MTTVWLALACLSGLMGCGPQAAPTGAGGGNAQAAGDPDTDADHRARPMEDAVEPDSDAETEPLHSDAATDTADGALFDEWEDPSLVVFVTGQQQGYVEPCGCTGLANQKGGLARRHTLVRQLAARGWPVLAIDAGNLVRRAGRQAEIKYQLSIDAMREMGYQVLALGGDDFRLSIGDLISATAPLDGEASRFVSANAAILDESFTPTHQVIELGGKEVGVTAVIGEAPRSRIRSEEIVHRPAAEALRKVVPQLEAAACDLYVLVADATDEEVDEYVQQFPLFDAVLRASPHGDPLYQPQRIGENGRVLLIETGVKAMHAGVLGLFEDRTSLRYQRVALTHQFEDSREVLDLFAAYQNQLERLALDGLGVTPVAHPSGNRFVGSAQCGECHTKAFEKWASTPHAGATDALVHPSERIDIPRHFDPECLSCHVTGWHPQRFFPYDSGYLSLEGSPLLHGNGCENCHGPGSAHVAAELGEVDVEEEKLRELRAAMRLPLESAEQTCLQCHDIDNDPHFHEEGAFQRYWKLVEHRGLD